MDEKVADGEISFIALVDDDDNVYGYEIFLAWLNGSGVTVTGDTKEEVVEKVKGYLFDALTDAETEGD